MWSRQVGQHTRPVLSIDGKIENIDFKNASWARSQIIKKDKNDKPNFYLGSKYKSFDEFLKKGDVIVIKYNKIKEDQFYSLSQIPEVNGAIVVLDPNNGRVLAMSGGYSFQKSKFNRATQAKRQPGSAFKPFVYLAGLERFYKPTDLIHDAALAYEQCSGCPKWKPANYTKKFYGPSPIRLGIEKSRNLMTARLATVAIMFPLSSSRLSIISVINPFKIFCSCFHLKLLLLPIFKHNEISLLPKTFNIISNIFFVLGAWFIKTNVCDIFFIFSKFFNIVSSLSSKNDLNV